MRPEPTPTLKGKAAKAFLKQIEQPLTENQRRIFIEADKVFKEIKHK